MASDKVRDHLHGNSCKLPVPWIENTAPGCLINGNVVLMGFIDPSAVDFAVSSKHALELPDGSRYHPTVMPGRSFERFSPQALQPSVKPVKHRQVGLADPAVAPDAFCKSNRPSHLHDIHYHVRIVVAPDVPEIIPGIRNAAPLSVFIKPGLRLQDFTQAAFPVGFSVPEITQGFFYFFHVRHYFCPPFSIFSSTLSTKAWKRVRS